MKNVKATIYRRPSRLSLVLAYLTAFILLIMAVAQLFDFEKMQTALVVLLPVDIGRGVLPIAAIIVVIEVFALPYFLPVPLSKLARWCGLGCALLAPIIWIVIMIVGAAYQGANVPMLGGVITTPLGIGSYVLALVLLGLVITVMVGDIRETVLPRKK